MFVRGPSDVISSFKFPVHFKPLPRPIWGNATGNGWVLVGTRMPGMGLRAIAKRCQHHSLLQDLANQIYWWDEFSKACRKNHVPKGTKLNPEVAEFLCGFLVKRLFVDWVPGPLSLSLDSKDCPGVGQTPGPVLSSATSSGTCFLPTSGWRLGFSVIMISASLHDCRRRASCCLSSAFSPVSVVWNWGSESRDLKERFIESI